MPVGGHKGYGMALVHEMLTAVLTGGKWTRVIKSLYQEMKQEFKALVIPSRSSTRIASSEEASSKGRWTVTSRALKKVPKPRIVQKF